MLTLCLKMLTLCLTSWASLFAKVTLCTPLGVTFCRSDADHFLPSLASPLDKADALLDKVDALLDNADALLDNTDALLDKTS